MLELLNEKLPHCQLKLESNISDIKDGWDYVYLIIECEKYYNLEIKDDEADFFNQKDFTFSQLHEFILFLKKGHASHWVHKTIMNNIEKLSNIRDVYIDYIINNRNYLIIRIIK